MCMAIGGGWKGSTGPEVMNHDNITQERPKTLIWAHLGLWRPLGASRAKA